MDKASLNNSSIHVIELFGDMVKFTAAAVSTDAEDGDEMFSPRGRLRAATL
jgi:hypothetical protein